MEHEFLADFVERFAAAMRAIDARQPQAANARSRRLFQPGIGPHSESDTVSLVAREIAEGDGQGLTIGREVRYPSAPRNRCDICIGEPPNWSWAIEVKMLRLMGDNGKPNDNILMHLLSPYHAHRSAVTDVEKLAVSGFPGRKALMIYAYEYATFPSTPAIEAFEALASRRVHLGPRVEAAAEPLVHPVHKAARVYAWEIGDVSPHH